MIRPEDVRKHLDRRPFEPFRICLTDGKGYDIRHPELCLIDRSTLHVGVPDPRHPGIAMDTHYLALVHIVRFEPINGTQKNGRSRKRKRRS